VVCSMDGGAGVMGALGASVTAGAVRKYHTAKGSPYRIQWTGAPGA
jgi:hypothetical protein